MFQRKIYLDNESYIEISTRIYDGEERIMITISGKKSDKEKVVSSAILAQEHASLFSKCLSEALERKPSWPIEKGDVEEDVDDL
jgi:hypothetical protein